MAIIETQNQKTYQSIVLQNPVFKQFGSYEPTRTSLCSRTTQRHSSLEGQYGGLLLFSFFFFGGGFLKQEDENGAQLGSLGIPGS